jgi:hypothetical protein
MLSDGALIKATVRKDLEWLYSTPEQYSKAGCSLHESEGCQEDYRKQSIHPNKRP